MYKNWLNSTNFFWISCPYKTTAYKRQISLNLGSRDQHLKFFYNLKYFGRERGIPFSHVLSGVSYLIMPHTPGRVQQRQNLSDFVRFSTNKRQNLWSFNQARSHKGQTSEIRHCVPSRILSVALARSIVVYSHVWLTVCHDRMWQICLSVCGG